MEFLTCLLVPEPSDHNSAMARIDVWDAAPIEPPTNLDCGFPRSSIESKYRIGKELGQGGFGSVRVVEDLSNGAQFAVKSIRKSLDIPNVTAAQLERHLDNIRREVQVLRKLRGTVRGRRRDVGRSDQRHARSMHSMQSCMAGWQCHTRNMLIGCLRGAGQWSPKTPIHPPTCMQLNVVALEDVFEDDASVHIVMELAKGGELLHNLGKRHYSEGTASTPPSCACSCCSDISCCCFYCFSFVRLIRSNTVRRWRATCVACCGPWRSATTTRSCTETSNLGEWVGGWAGLRVYKNTRCCYSAVLAVHLTQLFVSAVCRNFMLLTDSEDAPLKAIGKMGEREGGGRDGGRDGGSQLCFTGDVFTI